VQKLKDARSEAAKEIEEYKAKKEAEYKKFESEVSAFAPMIPVRQQGVYD
jgi:V-type H+-transporting ATPase subunit G